MAAPHQNRSHPDDPAFQRTREKIRTTQLVKRLEFHVLGENDDADQPVKMDSSQVAAARILIDKSLPSLQAVELTGEGGGPVQYANLTEDELDARIAEALKEAEEQGK